MNRPVVSEQDILALVEGRLPRERVPQVRAALESDPALLARVQGMVRDRQVMASMPSRAQAPDGLIRAAIRQANEDRARGTVSSVPETGEWGDDIRREERGLWSHRWKIVTGLAATLLLATLVGVIAIAMLPDRPPAEIAEGTSLGRHRPADMTDAEWDEFLERQQAKYESTEPVEEVPRIQSPRLTEFIDDEQSRKLATMEQPFRVMGPVPPDDYELVVEPAAPSDTALANADVTDPDDELLDEALLLLRDGRLRLVVSRPTSALASDTGGWQILEGVLSAGDAMEPSEDLASPATHERRPHERFSNGNSARRSPHVYRAHLSGTEHDDADLRESLRALLDDVAPLNIDGTRDVRIEQLDSPLRSEATSVSLSPSDILWWTRDPATWNGRFGVVLEVVVRQ